jgi:HB1, ASXL, restriction endonuclease HTH domain
MAKKKTATKTTRMKAAQTPKTAKIPQVEAGRPQTAVVPEATPTPGKTKPSRKAKAAQPGKVSAVSAADQVLAARGEAMSASELIAAMAEQDLWTSPNGKTPANTLYAAILREIATKGRQARFRKMGRGKFVSAG